jgi:hypothetical protein
MRRIALFVLTFVYVLAVQAGHAQLPPLTTISLQNETANNTAPVFPMEALPTASLWEPQLCPY